MCGQSPPEAEWRLTHVLPLHQEGVDSKANLIPCCTSCVSAKGGKALEDYRAYLQQRVLLSDEQLHWIQALGYPVTNDDAPQVVFAFEREGWAR